MERPLLPAGSVKPEQEEPNMDEATMLYMKKETRLCGGCGGRVIKSSGCNKMQCLCGYRFCYKCGQVGASCDCDGVGHGFFDNVLLQADFSSDAIVDVEEMRRDTLNYLSAKRERVKGKLAERRKEYREYQARKQKSEERKAKIIQRVIQNDVDMAVELYLLEMDACGGTPVWSAELTPYLCFLGKSEIEAVFPGVPCPKIYFPSEQQQET